MGFLLLDQSLVYTSALALVGLLVGFEVIGLIVGLSPSSALDELLPFDLEGALPSAWLGWVGMGAVPSYVWLLIALGSFGMVGLGLNRAATQLLGAPLGLVAGLVPALVLGLCVTSVAARGVARVLPSEESSAADEKSFEGLSAQIRVGRARKGHPAEASFVDPHGQRHYVLVEPLEEGASFEQGETVLLVEKKRTAWSAVGNLK